MATTSTAGRPLTLGRLGLHALLVAILVAVQATALTHEFEHLLHLHDAPCGLHVAAEHLVIVSAPEPALAVPLVPRTAGASLALGLLRPSPARPSTARAPPLPSR